MINPKFSVIIPVYNCENYIIRCIESILCQNYSNFELICVDDCSTDGSLSILHKYAEKDKRITVIESEVNRGGLSARRKGVYVAKGEYIIFVDSDDYVSEELLSFAAKTTAEVKKDIIQYNAVPVTDVTDGNYISWLTKAAKAPDVTLSSTSELLDTFFVTRKVNTTLWGKIFKTDMCKKAYGLLGDLQIDTNRGEDVIAFFAIALFANGYRGVESDNLYFYNYGLGSSNHKNKSKKEMEANCRMADACIQLEKYISSTGKQPNIVLACKKMAERLFTDCCRIINLQMDSEIKEMSAKVLVNKWYDVNIDDSVWISNLGLTKEQFRNINNQTWYETIKNNQKRIIELEKNIINRDEERKKLQSTIEKYSDEIVAKKDLIEHIKEENSHLLKCMEYFSEDNQSLKKKVDLLIEKEEKLFIEKTELMSLAKNNEKKILSLEKELKRKNEIYYDVTNSVSFKVGRFITWLPRKIKKLFKKLI